VKRQYKKDIKKYIRPVPGALLLEYEYFKLAKELYEKGLPAPTVSSLAKCALLTMANMKLKIM